MIISRTCGRATAAGTLGLLLIVAACAAIVDVQFECLSAKFHFEGYVGQLPPGAKPLNTKAKVRLPGLGEFEVDVYDTDGDGEGDMGGPIPPNGKYAKGHLEAVSMAQDLAAGAGPLRSAVADPPESQPQEFVLYENPPGNPMPVVFDQSVAAYFAAHGLLPVVPGENQIGDPIELLAAGQDLSLPTGLRLDLRLHWNTEAGFVDIEQFPNLQYEFYGLGEEPHTWPHYMPLRVAGDAGAVLNFLGHLGVTELAANAVLITDPTVGSQSVDHIEVAISVAAGLAQVSLDGVVSYLPLGT